MFDAHRLRLLLELDRRGTVAEVARALSYSPSTISQQLGTLEREAGCELIIPAGRRLQLTPQAQVLVGYAARILDLMDEAAAAVEASRTAVGGTVRLAVFQSASHSMVPHALSELAADYPELRVEVTELDPEAALLRVAARDFDLVLAEQYPGYTRPIVAELDRIPLAQDRIHVATALGSEAPLSIGDLADRPWVMEPLGTASRQWALQTCRQVGFEPDVRFDTADLVAQVKLVRNGNAVGLLPDLVWAGEKPEVRLSELPHSPVREIFSSARLATAARPSVVAVRTALRRAADAFAAR
ncbi:LysR family transcriptional regulator [Rarobacter faecitabidus]|uniref:DNA-binding transcriptional LysR family regulator n=1 Tax=Rarobacter faecitabidus TaxID=13243 RepID=A0A542ZWY3_RARFA|nr:LysR substrate-binding domain-containing protein [Rarobacter faecitabidus]TQL64858.1 DNA-binding transcriptional LysR family regulator [Rarobacter faecitabidus]